MYRTEQRRSKSKKNLKLRDTEKNLAELDLNRLQSDMHSFEYRDF